MGGSFDKFLEEQNPRDEQPKEEGVYQEELESIAEDLESIAFTLHALVETQQEMSKRFWWIVIIVKLAVFAVLSFIFGFFYLVAWW